MQKISDSTNTANAAGEFTEGNAAGGIPATLLRAAWLNAIQRELVAVIEAAGLSLDPSDDSQLLAALRGMLEGKLDANGTAAVAAKLATARTVRTNLASTGTASFDGSANITPGVTGVLPIANGGTGNTTGTAASAATAETCTGNAATATKLATARTINGVAFDGTGNITVADSTKLPLTGGTLTGPLTAPLVHSSGYLTIQPYNATYEDGSNARFYWDGVSGELRFQRSAGGTASTIYITATGFKGQLIGNADTATLAATATKLATARTINGVAFDGSANITIADDTKLPLSGGAMTGALGILRGSAAAPSLYFSDDTDTGLYRSGTNGLGIATGGSPAVTFDAAGNTTIYGRLRSYGDMALVSWTTTGCVFDAAAAVCTDTSSAAGATVALRAASSFNRQTFAAANAVTITNAATLYIANAPLAGDNVTLTNAWALWIASGGARIGGAVTVTGTVTAPTFAGALSGNASTATALATARTLRTNLGSTSTASFDGSANVTPGVTGTLPIANGGTGATTAAAALTALGAGKPATASLGVAGWWKDADTGFMKQWIVVSRGDTASGHTAASNEFTVTWPTAFTTVALYAQVTVREATTGRNIATIAGYYELTTTSGAFFIEEWTAATQDISVVIEVTGY